MRVGIIGTGQMGAMLAAAWATTDQAHTVLLHNRTRSKAEALAASHPGRMTVIDDVRKLAAQSDAVFICTKTAEAADIVQHIAPSLRPEHFVALTNSSTPLAWLETVTPSSCAKIIPSLTQYARAGVILVMPGERMTGTAMCPFHDLLAQIGLPHVISEEQVRIYSDLTSCGPAFLSAILLDMAAAAVKRGVPRQTAELLIGEMLFGLGMLVARKGFVWNDIIARVSVPGGVTLAGLDVLRQQTDALFDRVFSATEEHQQKNRPPGDGSG